MKSLEISDQRPGIINHLKELYNHRELLSNLVKRELKVKYKRSAFGFLWSFLNPLVLVVVYSVVVGKVMGMDKAMVVGYGGEKSFAAYLLTGLLAWNYLANSLVTSVGSIVDSGNLVKKIYFPREIIPFASVIANLVNFSLELIVLFIFLTVVGFYFYIQIPFLVVVILIETFFILGISALISLTNVYFRDMKHLTSVLLMIWFWACPIIYPFLFVIKFGKTRPWFPVLYKLNPMASIIMMYQRIFYFGRMPSLTTMAAWLVFSIVFFLMALAIFKAKEENIASEV